MSATDVKWYADAINDDRRRQKGNETRQRLIQAGQRLFAEQGGYDGATAAEIAAAAGVTERTFFRHFSSKSDLVLSNWRTIAASVEDAMAGQPAGAAPLDVVRAGLTVFAQGISRDIEEQPASTMMIYASKLPVLTMLEIVLALESAIAAELGRRLSRSDEDLHVRAAANASIGVLRACGRSYALGSRTTPLINAVSRELEQLSPLFDRIGARRKARRSPSR